MRKTLIVALCLSLLLVSSVAPKELILQGTAIPNNDSQWNISRSNVILKESERTVNITGNVSVQGVLFLNTGTKPACSAATRGTIAVTSGALGVADTIEVCVKSALDVYAYLSLV